MVGLHKLEEAACDVCAVVYISLLSAALTTYFANFAKYVVFMRDFKEKVDIYRQF